MDAPIRRFFSPFAVYVYFYSLVASFDLFKFQEFVRTILVKNLDARIVVVGTALDIKDRTVPTFHLKHLELDKLVRCCENIFNFLGTRYGYNVHVTDMRSISKRVCTFCRALQRGI
jgi:hypothetical protein